MDQKNSEQKTAQILYITIIMVLLIMAVTVGIVSAANKAKMPPVSTDTTVSTKAPVETTVHTQTTAQTSLTTAPVTTAPPPVHTTATATSAKPTVAEPVTSPLPTFAIPVKGNISAEFSIDTLVFSNTMEDYRTHNGIDVCAPLGSAVCAAADGIVTDVYEHPMMGYTVVIAHDGESQTVYHNMDDDITVSVGNTVKCGDVLGAVGESAIIEIAEEPHLHFEMCIAGERVNP